MIDITTFEAIPAGTVFRSGYILDSPEGVNMSGSGKMLGFVARKGHADDWCVYVHWIESGFDFIETNGDKVCDPDNIIRAVPCSPEVLERYRY